MIGPGLPLLLAVLSLAAGADAQTGPAVDHVQLERLRGLYYAAVKDRGAIEPAERKIAAARATATPGSDAAILLRAYAGAVTTLRAKHGRWPHARLRDLTAGLRDLDAAVTDRPALVEARYLRLMSCYYLPAILGRRESVREDFAELARLLPAARDGLPPDLYRAVAAFVLEHGNIDERARARLASSLERAR